MKKILTLPTWQVFVLLILPCIFPSSYCGIVLTILYGIFSTNCIYFLGTSLYKKLPVGHDLKIKSFTFYLFFAIAYLTIVFILFDGGYEINQDNYKNYGWTIAIIIPLHIFTMFSLFYVIWFIAKAIETIERKNVVGFGEYAGNFFLLWFFPIGIWWVHPKVRKIFQVDIERLPTTRV